LGLFVAAVAAAFPPSPSAQGSDLVTLFEVEESAFSPDGDGSQDSTAILLQISEDSPSLAIVLYESDSTTVVDTLRAAAPQTAGADTVTVFWNGTDAQGGFVPEGLYLVTLFALGTTAGDTVITLPVVVDNTPPAIQILLSEPGIYAPGLTGTPQVYSVTFVVSNTSPTFGIPTLEDQLEIKMLGGASDTVAIGSSVHTEPEFEGRDGMYELTWDASKMAQVVDGRYRFVFTVTDEAGHAASATDRVNLDVRAPDVGFYNMQEGQTARVVPDSLHAWAWDRNGIDSLYVKYADAGKYRYIADTHTAGDTTVFWVPLADSVGGEGTHRLTVRAKDAVAADTGWVAKKPLRFTVDVTAPPPPVLEPFDGIWRGPEFTLRGTWTSGTETIRFYRNGTLMDSVLTLALDAKNLDAFAQPIPLVEGVNVLTSTAVDEAFNESGPSNQVVVEFVGGSGLFIPAPFGPNDEFHLNLGDAADRATLRVYDLSGELVVSLASDLSARNYAFVWDGRNGDGDDVKKGPLVAVSQAEYGTGPDVVFREIFLFDPGKQ
jgi:flagellar hook assembly protein FlgD